MKHFNFLALAVLILLSACTADWNDLPIPQEKDLVFAGEVDVIDSQANEERGIESCTEVGFIKMMENTEYCKVLIRLEEGQIIYPINYEMLEGIEGRDTKVYLGYELVNGYPELCEGAVAAMLTCIKPFEDEVPVREIPTEEFGSR